MEIRVLRTFVTVAQLKGFSAAARALNTVQPAVSRQISDLEEEVGVRLFWRSTRDVRITAAGETLLREALEILAHEERARKLVQRAGSGQIGRLRIGFISSACQAFLPGLVRAFTQDFPDVQVTLTEMNADAQAEALATGQLDIALSRALPPRGAADVESLEIYVDRLMAFVPDDHPLAARQTLQIGDLAPVPFVLFQRSGASGLFDQIVSACRDAGFSIDIAHQSNSMQAVLSGVASGLGVSIAPGCIRQLNMAGCKSLPLLEDAGPVPFVLHHRADQIEPPTRAFIDLAIESRADIQEKMKLSE